MGFSNDRMELKEIIILWLLETEFLNKVIIGNHLKVEVWKIYGKVFCDLFKEIQIHW